MEAFALYAGNLSQLFVAILALWTLFFISKNRDVFGSELTKAQFKEIHRIRTQLSEIYFDIYYVVNYKRDIENFYKSIDEFRAKSPKDWEQYKRYNENSLELFYKFMLPSYYLLPAWIDKKEITKMYNDMKSFVPFTIAKTGTKTAEEIAAYQNRILQLMELIDVSTVKHGGRR